ncbi:xenotropic and polytropic retrovirus receptor 1-like protein [Labeo rohita]|uniref:Xenotropic and polytropic retrovirus receptor 1-like protein n=1 Tax=Labeo rohita TaxID=84645 RepID=A0A498NDL9_LABRO|nr:xenotropic and polytropic retrovirus receptor 1-like protein [Labeo rohita]
MSTDIAKSAKVSNKMEVSNEKSNGATEGSLICTSSFRCSVCIFFCLENKHLNNCSEFRAVRDVSVSSLNADDQTLLEQMMEQEDHVRNRLRKKNQKSP